MTPELRLLLVKIRQLVDNAEDRMLPDGFVRVLLNPDAALSDLAPIQLHLDVLLREPAPLTNPGKDSSAGGVPWRGGDAA